MTQAKLLELISEKTQREFEYELNHLLNND